MAARELTGMVLMALAAFFTCIIVILSTLAGRLHMPFYTLLGSAVWLVAFVILAKTCASGELRRLSRNHVKWVLIRGLFGTGLFILTLLANVAGAPLGDVSALQSINVVVAALLGRAFLGEPLRKLHWLALLGSVVGAVLVSNPETLFSSSAHRPLLGYFIALLAGLISGAIFIASRKSQGVNPMIMTMSVMLQEGLVLLLLPQVGVVHDPGMNIMTDDPLKAAAGVLGLALVAGASSLCLSAGAQLCPASASSTVFTSVGLSMNYAAQTVLHNDAPSGRTLLGACFMAVSVVVMAVARPGAAAAVGPGAAEAPAGGLQVAGDQAEQSLADDMDEVTSLASFVASEFSGLSLSPKASSARQRRAALAVLPAAATIGAASA